MLEFTCRDCKHWRPNLVKTDQGACRNPKRKNVVCIHNYNYTKANDYCALIEPREERHGTSEKM